MACVYLSGKVLKADFYFLTDITATVWDNNHDPHFTEALLKAQRGKNMSKVCQPVEDMKLEARSLGPRSHGLSPCAMLLSEHIALLMHFQLAH